MLLFLCVCVWYALQELVSIYYYSSMWYGLEVREKGEIKEEGKSNANICS